MDLRPIVTAALCACGNQGSSVPPDAHRDVDATTSPDAAPDAAPAACASTICEDFEGLPAGPLANGALGAWTVKVTGTVTVAAIDAVKPYAGTRSLHVTVPAGTAAGATLAQTIAGGLVAGNNLYGRAMVYFSSAAGNAAPINVHSWLFQGLGTSTVDGGPVTMNWGDGGTQMQLNYHPFGAAESSVKDAPQMTPDAWHCVQWQFDGSGTPPADVAKVWVDGAVVVSVPKSMGWHLATPWTSFNVGFMHYQTLATPADVYVDEIALDGSMIACP